jgi:hypothetical protein
VEAFPRVLGASGACDSKSFLASSSVLGIKPLLSSDILIGFVYLFFSATVLTSTLCF